MKLKNYQLLEEHKYRHIIDNEGLYIISEEVVFDEGEIEKIENRIYESLIHYSQ